MTSLSVLTAAKTLLATALPAFRTVDLIDNVLPKYEIPMYPMLLLQDEDSDEQRVATGVRLSEWNLCAYVWNYEPGPAPYDVSTFLGYLETITSTFRANPRFGGLADTSTSVVSTFCEGPHALRVRRPLFFFDGSGGVTRYAEIRGLVRETSNS